MRRKQLEGRLRPSKMICRSPDDRCSSSHFTIRLPRFLLSSVMGKEMTELLCNSLGTSVKHSPIKSCFDRSSYALPHISITYHGRISLRICVVDDETQLLDFLESVRHDNLLHECRTRVQRRRGKNACEFTITSVRPSSTHCLALLSS